MPSVEVTTSSHEVIELGEQETSPRLKPGAAIACWRRIPAGIFWRLPERLVTLTV
jgi:hypothetical protein